MDSIRACVSSFHAFAPGFHSQFPVSALWILAWYSSHRYHQQAPVSSDNTGHSSCDLIVRSSKGIHIGDLMILLDELLRSRQLLAFFCTNFVDTDPLLAHRYRRCNFICSNAPIISSSALPEHTVLWWHWDRLIPTARFTVTDWNYLFRDFCTTSKQAGATVLSSIIITLRKALIVTRQRVRQLKISYFYFKECGIHTVMLTLSDFAISDKNLCRTIGHIIALKLRQSSIVPWPKTLGQQVVPLFIFICILTPVTSIKLTPIV